MSLAMYALCGFISLLGATLHLLIKMKDRQDFSKRANTEFFPGQFLKDERISICISLVSIIIALLVVSEGFEYKPKVFEYKLCLFSFWGYFSDSILSRVFGYADKRFKAVVDDKTSQIDKINNTLDAPTPATMPGDKPKP